MSRKNSTLRSYYFIVRSAALCRKVTKVTKASASIKNISFQRKRDD